MKDFDGTTHKGLLKSALQDMAWYRMEVKTFTDFVVGYINSDHLSPVYYHRRELQRAVTRQDGSGKTDVVPYYEYAYQCADWMTHVIHTYQFEESRVLQFGLFPETPHRVTQLMRAMGIPVVEGYLTPLDMANMCRAARELVAYETERDAHELG